MSNYSANGALTNETTKSYATDIGLMKAGMDNID